MNRSVILLSLVGCMIFPAPAHASEWWFVTIGGEKPNRTVYFIDKESATASYGKRINVWTYEIDERLNQFGVRKRKVRETFDCGARTIRLTNIITYGNNSVLKDSIDVPSYKQEDDGVVPDSIGEARWNFVCRDSSNGFKVESPEATAAVAFRI